MGLRSGKSSQTGRGLSSTSSGGSSAEPNYRDYLTIIGKLQDNTNYTVHHVWRKEGRAIFWLKKIHHSQLEITPAGEATVLAPRWRYRKGEEVLPVTKISVGVFGPRKASIVARYGLPGTFYEDGGTHDTEAGSWHLSTSYDPNPVVKTGKEIKDAIADVAKLMKPYYDLFNNNCQTFAREVMGRLGSLHTRDPYH